MEKLTDDMLEIVSGGLVEHVEKDEYGRRYCKYCDKFRTFVPLGNNPGWDNEKGYYSSCEVFRCDVCQKDTYWFFGKYLN